MTHLLQPLDVSVNGHVKTLFRDHFEQWYAEGINKQLAEGINLQHITINCNLSALKELHAQWIISIYIQRTSFSQCNCKAGILDAIHTDFNVEVNPFGDLLK